MPSGKAAPSTHSDRNGKGDFDPAQKSLLRPSFTGLVLLIEGSEYTYKVVLIFRASNAIQRSAKVFVRGREKFVTALAYLFCLALVGSCLARFAYFLAYLCIVDMTLDALKINAEFEGKFGS